jgi:hypothetical protein
MPVPPDAALGLPRIDETCYRGAAEELIWSRHNRNVLDG